MFTTTADVLDIPIAKFITISSNMCRYSGTAEEIIVDYVHNLFLKDKAEEFREDNPNWREAINSQFSY